jgi:hypothetical protein
MRHTQELELANKTTDESHRPSLVRASTFIPTEIPQLRSEALSRFVALLLSPLDAFAAAQTPVLFRLDRVLYEKPMSPSIKAERLMMNDYGKEEEGALDKGILRMLLILEVADLARRGTQQGPKHGYILTVPQSDDDESSSKFDAAVGRGWNHSVFDKYLGCGRGKNRVLHAEVHAVADAVRNFGETIVFLELFPRATAIIVELANGDTGTMMKHRLAQNAKRCFELGRFVMSVIQLLEVFSKIWSCTRQMEIFWGETWRGFQCEPLATRWGSGARDSSKWKRKQQGASQFLVQTSLF